MFTETKFKANRDEVRRAEETAAALFRKMGYPVTVNPTPKTHRNLAQLREADLLYQDTFPYVELKVDYKSVLTGNVCIETGSLERSEAHYVVYMLPSYFCAPRIELLTQANFWPPVKGGDWGDELRLIPRKEFIKLTKRIG